MGVVTLIVVLAAVSWLVCTMSMGGRPGARLREWGTEEGRRAMVSARRSLRSAPGAVVRAAGATSAALLRADEILRRPRASHRPGFTGESGWAARSSEPVALAADVRPSRFLALVELLLLTVLTGAALAGAVAGVAWGVGRLLT